MGGCTLDVKEADGTVVIWEFGTASVSMLRRIGWTRDTLKVGDTLAVSGFRARDGRRFLGGSTARTPDGRRLFDPDGPATDSAR